MGEFVERNIDEIVGREFVADGIRFKGDSWQRAFVAYGIVNRRILAEK